MKVFVSGLRGRRNIEAAVRREHRYLFSAFNSLGSKPGPRLDHILNMIPEDREFFLDNSCYTLQKQQLNGSKTKIDERTIIEGFTKLLKTNSRYKEIDHYCAIDPHINGFQTVKDSLKYMEDESLEPMPVFHIDWSIEKLDAFLGSYDKIGIGKYAQPKIQKAIGRRDARRKMVKVLQICHRHDIDAHVFGCGNPKDFWRFKEWAASVDSANWLEGPKHGHWYDYGEHYHGYFKKHKKLGKEPGYRTAALHNLTVWKKIADYYERFGGMGQ